MAIGRSPLLISSLTKFRHLRANSANDYIFQI
jgi:hypothetical protein